MIYLIKGVSKRVVEINNPESIYFEKAIFYIKPHMSDMPEKLLAREADEYISELSADGGEKNEKSRFAFSLICIGLSIILLVTGIAYNMI